MNGGQVRFLKLPAVGLKMACKGRLLQKKNYVKVSAWLVGRLREDPAIGKDRVVTYLEDVRLQGDVITFTFDNLQVQPSLGIATFTISSAGTRGNDPS